MTFEQSVEYLYGLGNEVSAMKLGLENIKILLDALGNPEKNYLKIQIAGTNGKGSTCAFLEAICVSARIKTGLTTSPHLISIRERVKINGKEITEKEFARHATGIRKTSEKLVAAGKLETVPTFFEQVTAIALNAFAEAKVELAILETGLGGRFDATTAARAEIAAIAPIDYDHQQILGDTIEEIGAEKAAIIDENTRTVIVARQRGEALKVILERCANFGVTPKLARAVKIKQAKNGESRRVGKGAKHFESKISGFKTVVENQKSPLPTLGFPPFDFCTEKAEYKNIRLGLLGKHQIENAATAILLAETLADYFPVATENIVEGLRTATHRGRLEFRKNFLFDGAHNVAGARALKEFLDEYVENPVTMIFGAMNDKDLREIARILFPAADKIIYTEPNNSRSVKASKLMKLTPDNFDKEKVFKTKTVSEAVKLAGKISAATDLICVTGSLYLVGEAQKELTENDALRDL